MVSAWSSMRPSCSPRASSLERARRRRLQNIGPHPVPPVAAKAVDRGGGPDQTRTGDGPVEQKPVQQVTRRQPTDSALGRVLTIQTAGVSARCRDGGNGDRHGRHSRVSRNGSLARQPRSLFTARSTVLRSRDSLLIEVRRRGRLGGYLLARNRPVVVLDRIAALISPPGQVAGSLSTSTPCPPAPSGAGSGPSWPGPIDPHLGERHLERDRVVRCVLAGREGGRWPASVGPPRDRS